MEIGIGRSGSANTVVQTNCGRPGVDDEAVLEFVDDVPIDEVFGADKVDGVVDVPINDGEVPAAYSAVGVVDVDTTDAVSH